MFSNEYLIQRIEKLNLELARTKRERNQAIELGSIVDYNGFVESRANLENDNVHGVMFHRSDARDLYYFLTESEDDDE